MLELRERLISLGMTGYVEQQQVIQEVFWWIADFKKENPNFAEEFYWGIEKLQATLCEKKSSINQRQTENKTK